MNLYSRIINVWIVCVLCMLSTTVMAQTELTRTFSIKDLINGLTDEGETPNSRVTDSLKTEGKVGHKYSISVDDWKVSISDACVNPNSGKALLFQSCYARISTTPNRRIRSIKFQTYEEHDGVYIHHNTYNGTLSSNYEGDGEEGYGTIKNATWTPRFGDTEYAITFVILGHERSSHESGYVLCSDSVIVTYVEDSEKFKEKITPTIGVEFPVLEAPINQSKVTEPTIVVYEDQEKKVRTSTNFALNYFIDMEPIQNPCIDSQTGSRINLLTGEVNTGSTPGEFRVVVRCFPVDGEQAEKYNTTVDHYIVRVHGQQGLIKYNGNTISDPNTPYIVNMFKDIEIVNPTISIVDEFGQDISSRYDLSHPEVVVTDENGNTYNINEYISHDNVTTTGIKNAKNLNVALSFSPTTSYINAYDEAVMNINLSIVERPGTKDAHVVFESSELSDTRNDLVVFKRNSGYFNELIVKVYDEFNNDISNNFNLTYAAVNRVLGMSYNRETRYTDMIINRLTADEAAYNNKIYKDTEGYTLAKEGDPLFETGDQMTTDGREEKVVFTVYSKTNAFNNVQGSLYIKIVKKEPEVIITPAQITLKTGNTWYSNNRINPLTIDAYSILEIEEKVGGKEWWIETREVPDGIVCSYNSGWGSSYYSITGTKEGVYKIPIHVRAWDNKSVRKWWFFTSTEKTYYDETIAYLTVNVSNKVIPIVKFSEDNIALRAGQDIVEPKVTITDSNGEDISSEYTLKYTELNGETNNIFKNTRASGDWWAGYQYYSLDGVINTDAEENEYQIRVTATPKNPDEYYDGYAEYSLVIFTPTWNYDINSIAGSDQFGKLYFIGEETDGNDDYTFMYPGTIIDAVPGIKVQFGDVACPYYWYFEDRTKADSDSHVFGPYTNRVLFDATKKTTTSVMREDGTSKTEDVNYLPVDGGFLKITPRCDGFLTVDALWEKGRTYVLIDINQGVVERETYIPSDTIIGEYRFKSSLRATDECYFYMMPLNTSNKYPADIDTETETGMAVYGINYEPAFIRGAADEESVTKARAYLNWNDEIVYDADGEPVLNADGSYKMQSQKVMHKDGLPYFSHSVNDYVSHSIESDPQKHISVNQEGIFDFFHATIGESGYVVKGHDATYFENGETKTSRVEEGRLRIYGKATSVERPNVSKTAYYDMMINSIPTYMVPANFTPEVRQEITAVDGIKMTWGGWNDHDLIDYTRNDYAVQDAWAQSKVDYKIGVNNPTIDGFLYESEMGGSSNAKSEKNLMYDPVAKNTFLLPCRGDYVKFEPTKAGTLYVYVLQKGCVEWNGVDAWNPTKNDMIRWRPLYIVDEHGEGVSLNNTKGGGSVTNSYYRCNNSDDETSTVNGVTKPFNYDRDLSSNLTQKEYNFINSVWPRDARGEVQKVFDISTNEEAPDSLRSLYTGGHIVISKGYVRYTFDVRPGKTYFVFQTGSKMGLAGFSFDSSVDEPDEDPSELYYNKNYKRADVSHTDVIYNRYLKKNKYNAFILPFSMSQEQVEKHFGKGTKITYFDDAITSANKLNFTRHYYQMVVAGDPCLIKPTFEGVNKEYYTEYESDDTWVSSVKIKDVSLDSRQPNEFMSKDGQWAYRGNYKNNYKPSVGTHYVSGGYLYRIGDNGGTFNNFYSFLEPLTSYAKKMSFITGFSDMNGEQDDTTTGVEDIYSGLDNHPLKLGGIYNLQGQKMQSDDLDNLPAGIYIVNGKKVIIK